MFCWAAWYASTSAPSRVANGSELVRPGVVHRTIIDKDGPWSIHVVEIDLQQPDLHIESACGEDRLYGREPVSSIAARKSDTSRYVAVAINGDYFNPTSGEVQNNHIVEGVFVKAFRSRGYRPEFADIPNSQFAVNTAGEPFIEQFMFAGSVIWSENSTSTLAGVNIIPRRGGLVIFNRYFGERTPPSGIDSDVRELSLRIVRSLGDTLVCVATGSPRGEGASFIPHDGIVLAAYREPFEVVHDSVRIVLTMQPNVGPLRHLVGGWPRIVRNGKSVFALGDFPEDQSATVFAKRHPRSAIGFSRDSTMMYFVTVDGRQDRSVGMSLPELADLMVRLGVYQGLNLDGGGSTTLVINGEVVNSPSDPTGERPIGNCLLLVADHVKPSTAEGTGTSLH